MINLSTHPVSHKWPAQHPDRLQCYSLPTPNGVKVSIMLEETGLPYEPHLVSFDTHDQTSPEFLSPNLNNKIPAEAVDLVGIQDFANVTRALAAFGAASGAARAGDSGSILI